MSAQYCDLNMIKIECKPIYWLRYEQVQSTNSYQLNRIDKRQSEWASLTQQPTLQIILMFSIQSHIFDKNKNGSIVDLPLTDIFRFAIV